jgi:iron complex transport system substrate-binding protein
MEDTEDRIRHTNGGQAQNTRLRQDFGGQAGDRIRNSKFKLYIFIILVLVVIAAAMVVLVSYLNRVRRFPAIATPDRIITISPNITEIAFALGLGEKIIAVSSDSDYPPEAKLKAKVGSFWQPDLEAIIAAKPNLVITETFEQHKAIADSLKRLNIKVLSLKIDTIREMVDAIGQISAAANQREATEEVTGRILSKIEGVEKKLAGKEMPRVLWVIQPEPLRVAGEKTFINEVIEIGGGKNAAGPTIQPYPQIDEEQLLTCRADVIIQAAMGRGDFQTQQKDAEEFWSKYSTIPAVRNKRIYVVNPDVVLRLGPRLPEGIETIARLLHPEEFSEKETTPQ